MLLFSLSKNSNVWAVKLRLLEFLNALAVELTNARKSNKDWKLMKNYFYRMLQKKSLNLFYVYNFLLGSFLTENKRSQSKISQ